MIRSLFSSILPNTLSTAARPAVRTPLRATSSILAAESSQSRGWSQIWQGQQRWRSQLAPKRTKYRKAHKGRVSGGSTKGTTLQLGTYGLRLLESTRLTAKQLTSAEVAVKRKIKPVKGAECWMRVFPDIPVCVKGNETRMGKGKGAFEYWACRVPIGRVVFEVGGGGIREEIAKEALRLASAKLPVQTEFISINSPPRLGATLVNKAASSTESAGEVALDGIIEGAADTALPAATLP
ncbi:39S ribosomal protein L16, mitochondrial [Naganishia albida]|nr:39S ribosomal protein L16, mitochondrial [Naganishia albida]